MFNITHLQQEQVHKTLLIKEIVDKAEKAEGGPRTLTTEECAIIDKLQGEIETLKTQIEAIKAHNDRREASERLLREVEEPAGRRTQADTPAPPSPTAIITLPANRIPASARRTGILKAFKPRPGEHPADAEMRAYRAGLWARAVLFRDDKAQSRCLSLGVTIDVRNAMGTTSNPDGGVLVPEELSQAIIDLREQYGILRRFCRVWPMGSDTLDVPRRTGGVTIGPLGENPPAGPPGSNPTFDAVKLVAKKAGGLTILSTEISEDSVIDLADWIANEYAYAFALFEDQCGFIGDGTSTYLGIQGLTTLLTTASGKAGAVAAASTHDTMQEIDNNDITKMMAALPQYAAGNAKFFCSRVFKSLVFDRLMATAGGNNVQTLQGSTGENYLGYPIVVSQVLPTSTGTINGTAMCFFGDLSKSTQMGDRRSVRLMTSRDRYMELDQIAILGTERIDIVNSDIGTNTVAGPIVALMGTT